MLRYFLPVIFLFAFFSCECSHDVNLGIPEPDLSKVEPQVAQKIVRLMKQVEQHPQSDTTWGKLAMNLDIHDFKLAAIPCYKKAAQLNSSEFRWPYFCAIALYESGKIPQAIKWFYKCIKIDSAYTPLLIQLGNALFQAGNSQEAEYYFKKALNLNGNAKAHACTGLARIKLNQGLLEESKKYLKAAIRENFKFREAHGLLAEVYRRSGQPDSARIELILAQKFTKITPLRDPYYEEMIAEGVSSLWYRKRGLGYMGLGKIDRALHEFQQALKYKPDAEGYVYLGKLYLRQNNYKEAIEQFRKALRFNANYQEAYLALAGTYETMGDLQQANNLLKTILQINPYYERAYIKLAKIYLKHKQISQAIGIMNTALNYLPDSAELLILFARTLIAYPQNKMDTKQILQMAYKACSLTHFSDPGILDTYAEILASQGKFQEAKNIEQKAYQLALSLGDSTLTEKIRNHLFKLRKN
ncbi:MAG: tetratricopeptide repeat protein [Calditrichaeota bacterium]|nr:MAG: tetratricopeptide repeat protein [Calditrichota bacterium]